MKMLHSNPVTVNVKKSLYSMASHSLTNSREKGEVDGHT